jgi:hypothetical protein
MLTGISLVAGSTRSSTPSFSGTLPISGSRRPTWTTFSLSIIRRRATPTYVSLPILSPGHPDAYPCPYHPAQQRIIAGRQKISQLNRQIEKATDKLHEDEPTNIAAIEDAKRVRSSSLFLPRVSFLISVLHARSQEAAEELESSLAQYEAGLADYKRSKEAMEPIITRKHEVEDELKAADKLLRSVVVRLQFSFSSGPSPCGLTRFVAVRTDKA